MLRTKGKLTAPVVRRFSELFLQRGYDSVKPHPPFHDELWELCCSDHKLVAIAAPRSHAKSTAITHAYVLASICLRYKKHVLIIADTEKQAINFLSDIRDVLRENQDVKEVFEVHGLVKDGERDTIVKFRDGSKAKISAKGSSQKIRGVIWESTRPDLVVIDDLEDDEAVENQERRDKLKRWLLAAVLPCLSPERGQIRMVGTIMHLDSALMSFMNSKAWHSRLYKAHNSFTDFGGLLWPAMHTKEMLTAIRQTYIDDGNPEGYSQEYLNDPSDLQNPIFRAEDFIPMTEEEHVKPKQYYVGCDFALSDADHSDYTVFVVGGYDADGILHIVDERRVRTNDTNVVIEELFSVQNKWNPDMYIFEGGVIASAIEPAFKVEMRQRGAYSYIHTYTPIKDKRLRASSIQQRMRSGKVRYDTEASWYKGHEYELRRFPKGAKKDRVDAVAWLGRGIAELVEAPTQAEINEDEWQEHLTSFLAQEGHSEHEVTGY